MSGLRDERALRIMEALSGVDEELLERCRGDAKDAEMAVLPEEAARRNGRSKEAVRRKTGGRRIYRFVQRHGGFWAACLGLTILCAACWAMGTGKSGEASGDFSRQEGIHESIALGGLSGNQTGDGSEGSLENQPENGAEEEVAKLSEQSVGIGAEPMMTRAEDIGGSQEAASPRQDTAAPFQGSVSGGVSEEDAGGAEDSCDAQSGITETDKMNGGGLQKESVTAEYNAKISGTWGDACALAGIEEEIFVKLPERYVPQGGVLNDQDQMLYTWSDGTHELQLQLTKGVSGIACDSEIPILDSKEDWESQLPQPEEDGSIRFAISPGGDVRLEYRGWLEPEELKELIGGLF